MAKILPVVALIVGVFLLGTAHADNIAINNPSFESPVQVAGVYNEGSVDGWTLKGNDGGVWYPVTGSYFTGPVPDGNQILYLDGGSVSQTLSSVLTGGDTYTLSIDVGHRSDGSWSSDYTIALLAGSITLVSGGGFDPGAGLWGAYTLSYTATAGSPSLGQSLAVELSLNSGSQTDFDNVTLSAAAAPVPLPSAFLLFGPGLVGLAAIRRRFKK